MKAPPNHPKEASEKSNYWKQRAWNANKEKYIG